MKKSCLHCRVEKEFSEFTYPSSKYIPNVCKKCSCAGNPLKKMTSDKFTFIKQCFRCHKFYPKTVEFFFKKLKSVSNNCKGCAIKQNKKYYDENSNLILEQKQTYYKENIDSIKEYREEYKKSEKAVLYYKAQYQKLRKNPLSYLRKNISARILNWFKSNGLRKNKVTMEILRCDREQFYNRLIKTFEDNYKIPWNSKYLYLVEIDHILPISLAMNEAEIYELNHHANLQFLFNKDNILKSNRLDWKLDLTKTKLYDTIKDLEK